MTLREGHARGFDGSRGEKGPDARRRPRTRLSGSAWKTLSGRHPRTRSRYLPVQANGYSRAGHGRKGPTGRAGRAPEQKKVLTNASFMVCISHIMQITGGIGV